MGNGLRISFGMHCDEAEWSGKNSSLGELCVGPMGMASLLRTRLGLGGVDAHQAIRINQYLQKVTAADTKKAWFHASFTIDKWSTARQLLAWRDELIAAGWNGRSLPAKSPRLFALSEIEKQVAPVAPGFADMLRTTLHTIPFLNPGAIAAVTLHEPPELLPPIWRNIFDALKQLGVTVKSTPAPVPAYDSFLLVESETEWESAEALSLWLSADPDGNADATLVVPDASSALDQAFLARGLPAPGGGGASIWRAHLQILPLILANAWEPVDVGALVELLALPTSPVPFFARKALLDALQKEAGIGGEAWNEALADIEESYLKIHAQKGKAKPEAKRFIANLQAMLVSDRYPADSGIPEKSVRERCKWLMSSLAPRVDDDPPLAEALRQASDMASLVQGKGRIPRVELERMLDSVIGIGGASPGNEPAASPWRVVSHPGAAYPCGTLIWWDFTAPAPAASTYWSQSERTALHAVGIELEAPGLAGKRDALAWRNGFGKARDRVLLFRAKSIRGEEAEPHPLWDEIIAVTEKRGGSDAWKAFVRQSGELAGSGTWRLADRKLKLARLARSPIPPVRAEYAVAKGSIAVPERTSYSDMANLIGCPLKWALGKRGRLRMSSAHSLPDANQSMGTLCHRIAQDIFVGSRRKWTPDAARREGERLFDRQVGSMCAELLAEGREIERSRNREEVGSAMRSLAAIIQKLGLRPEKAEAEYQHGLGDAELYGLADLLFGTPGGGKFIMDMKWTRSANWYLDELREGRAMQLAIYAWLVKQKHPGVEVGAGYFLLRQGRLVSDWPRLGGEGERVDSLRSLDAVFDMARRSRQEELKKLAAGQIVVKGVAEELMANDVDMLEEAEARGRLYLPPPCNFCDYESLCGVCMVRGDDDDGEAGE